MAAALSAFKRSLEEHPREEEKGRAPAVIAGGERTKEDEQEEEIEEQGIEVAEPPPVVSHMPTSRPTIESQEVQSKRCSDFFDYALCSSKGVACVLGLPAAQGLDLHRDGFSSDGTEQGERNRSKTKRERPLSRG